MRDGIGPLPVLASVALVAAGGAAVAGFLGTGRPVLFGLSAGLLLGWGGAAAELALLRRHLRTDFPRALRILVAGFGIRAVGILLGATLLDRAGFADGTAFGLGVVAGFLAFLPVLAAEVARGMRNGKAHG